MTIDINSLIQSPKTQIYRRILIKRRNLVTGLYESEWQDISEDIMSFGKIKSQIDSVRLYKFTFGTVKIVMDNTDGKYNPETSETSLWYGYLNQQRTLVKFEIGFKYLTLTSYGIWRHNELPGSGIYDISYWDDIDSIYDGNKTVFTGLISNDVPLSDRGEVSFNIAPLTQVFQEYPAKNLTGWTSTGMSASQFITMIRDQTDGLGSYIFRPFFGDTIANWDISTTTNIYSNLNTSTAKDIINKTVWEVIEKLSEAENYIAYITKDGKFKFSSRDPNTTTVAYEFHGSGSFDTTYGHTIKQITSYSKKISKYYSRVQVKWVDADTATSYEIVDSSMTVSSVSNPWVLGSKTLEIENFYIPNSTVAHTIALNIFNDYSALKTELEFSTSLIPHLDLLDRFTVYYDPSEVSVNSLWDQNNWADTSGSTSLDLTFDSSKGDAIILNGQEFKFLSLEIDLDNLENKFIAREV